jgi:hypothetical protein
MVPILVGCLGLVHRASFEKFVDLLNNQWPILAQSTSEQQQPEQFTDLTLW